MKTFSFHSAERDRIPAPHEYPPWWRPPRLQRGRPSGPGPPPESADPHSEFRSCICSSQFTSLHVLHRRSIMERSRTNNPPTRLRAGIAALGVAMSFAIGTGTVHAAGTASGTSISNLSTLNYSVGGSSRNLQSAHRPPETRGCRYGHDVCRRQPGQPGRHDDRRDVRCQSCRASTAQVTTFSVTNTGNTVQDFALASAQAANGHPLFGGTDNFDTAGMLTVRRKRCHRRISARSGHCDVHRRAGSGCITHRVCGLQHSGRAGQQR